MKDCGTRLALYPSRPAAFLSLAVLLLAAAGRCGASPPGNPSAFPDQQASVQPERHAHQPTAVIILAPDAGFKIIGSMATPAMERLAEEGAAGFINNRTVRSSLDEAFLTIGAGNRASASFDGEIGQAMDWWERFDGARADQVYTRRTGFKRQAFQVLALNYASLKMEEKGVDYTLEYGLLGDALRHAGIGTAALGNADEFSGVHDELVILHREVAGVAMDHLGRVLDGDVSTRLIMRDAMSPHGRRLDIRRVGDEFRSLRGKDRFIAIEDGDLLQVQHTATQYTPAVFKDQLQRALNHLDQLVAEVAAQLDFNQDLLIVCTPFLETPAATGSGLAPVLAIGPGLKAGWLTSSSTRRAGLVVNTDLAPTILRFFHLPSSPLIPGAPISSVPVNSGKGMGILWRLNPRESRLKAVKDLVARIDYRDDHRNQVQRWFVYLCQLSVILAALAAAFPGWVWMRRTLIRHWGFLIPLALPLAMILEPFLGPRSSILSAAELAVLTSVIIWLARYARSRELGPVVLLAWANAIAVTVDLLTGQQAMTTSMLSYSPSEGARYYGIGNEYMGVLVGASVTLCCMAASRGRAQRIIATIVLFIPVILICHPAIGAKAGGALVAFPTALLAAWMLWGGRASVRTLAVIGLLGAGALLALSFWDLHRGHGVSHIGKALGGVMAGGSNEAMNIISRKVWMEWRLVKYSPWSRMLLAAVVASGILYFARRDSWRPMLATQHFRAALAALALAMITSLLFNDAGVLAAALCFAYFPALVNEWLEREDAVASLSPSVGEAIDPGPREPYHPSPNMGRPSDAGSR